MNRFIFISVLIILVFLASLTLAGIPKMINYQGMLTGSDGKTPVTNGNYPILFSIYNTSSGGSSLWSHTYNVSVTNGLFNAILGDSGAPINLPFDTTYWLGIKVGADPQLSPRTRLTSVGYAFKAVNCDTALLASRHFVHFPHLNDIYYTGVPGTEWATIDMSRIVLDLSQYGGPVRVAISFCGNTETQLRLVDFNTGLGLNSTVVTGQGGEIPPHIIVTGPFASVSQSTVLALQRRATGYGLVRKVYEVSVIIEKLP